MDGGRPEAIAASPETPIAEATKARFNTQPPWHTVTPERDSAKADGINNTARTHTFLCVTLPALP